MQTHEKQPNPGGRWLHVLAVGALSVALVGFLAGTTHVERPAASAPTAQDAVGVPPAPSYRELRERGRDPLPPGASELLLQQMPPRDVSATVDPGFAEREQAVAARRQLRAFDGAPPRVPHVVGQEGLAACGACHMEGLLIGGKPIPQASHANYTNCTQCHVPTDAPLPKSMARLDQSVGSSSFVGWWGPSFGRRAWPGAPPATPHSTWMRNQCTACHGDSGALGLKTSHPWRTSCVQCHALQSDLENPGPPRSPLPPGPGAQAGEMPRASVGNPQGAPAP